MVSAPPHLLESRAVKLEVDQAIMSSSKDFSVVAASTLREAMVTGPLKDEALVALEEAMERQDGRISALQQAGCYGLINEAVLFEAMTQQEELRAVSALQEAMVTGPPQELEEAALALHEATTRAEERRAVSALQEAMLDWIHDIFEDGKSFVDMPLRAAGDVALVSDLWAGLTEAEKRCATTLTKFVATHFEEAGGELEAWMPEDYVADLPGALHGLGGKHLELAQGLHGLWPTLSRRAKAATAPAPGAARQWACRHTLLAPRHGFIIPGGRFRETYYWDSLWIVEGLLVSRMAQTAESMCRNLLHLVEEFGFVPNGARSYYADRSQPPVLSEMVLRVCEALAAEEDQSREGGKVRAQRLARDALPVLEREHAFWTTGARRVVFDDGTTLARYSSSRSSPRPESYREDLHTARHVAAEDRPRLYRDLAAAAESGWDFSSRWMRREADDAADLANFHALPRHERLARTATTSVVPVDLNAFLLRTESNIAALHVAFGVPGDAAAAAARRFESLAAQRRKTMAARLWDDAAGRFTDLWLGGIKPLDAGPKISDFTPLWAGVADDWPEDKCRRLLVALEPLVTPCGLRTSTLVSGEQWDAPNIWAPLQHLVVCGLRRLGLREADNLADKVRDDFLATAHAAYIVDGTMHEKYDAVSGRGGLGGEYEPQTGFGWSNGVALAFLAEVSAELPVPGHDATHVLPSGAPVPFAVA